MWRGRHDVAHKKQEFLYFGSIPRHRPRLICPRIQGILWQNQGTSPWDKKTTAM
jgi:hypothetical protein